MAVDTLVQLTRPPAAAAATGVCEVVEDEQLPGPEVDLDLVDNDESVGDDGAGTTTYLDADGVHQVDPKLFR